MSSATHRTPTRDQLVFELHYPHPVIYDFSNIATDGLKITVPPYSVWNSDLHWHYTPEACEDIWIVAGHFYFFHGMITNWSNASLQTSKPGLVIPLSPQRKVYWERIGQRDDPSKPAYPAEPVVVCYRFISLEMYGFYRQVCSVNQDAEAYFQLPSTPFWLRAIYASWGLIPFLGKKVRAWLLAWCLWIQLRVIYAKNDYWTDEGRIPYTFPWRDVPGAETPPEKWVKKELESIVLISKWVRIVCYLVGTRILGMKESYVEYGPVEQARGDKEEEILIKL